MAALLAVVSCLAAAPARSAPPVPAGAPPDSAARVAAPRDTLADTVAVTLTRPTSTPPADRRDAPWRVMLRSVAVPGWGQIYNRQYLKAGIAIAAEGGLLTTFLVANHQASVETDPQRQADAVNVRQAAVWFGAAVVLLSMADAYVDAHLYRIRERFRPIEVRLEPGPSGGAAVALAAGF